MTEPFMLTTEAVISANEKAIGEGTLIAMHPPGEQCLYRNWKGHGCAIGVALPEELIGRILMGDGSSSYNRATVHSLVNEGLMKAAPAVHFIQLYHDRLVRDGEWPGPEAYMRKLKELQRKYEPSST